jgi:hypothetical protein
MIGMFVSRVKDAGANMEKGFETPLLRMSNEPG